MLKSRERVLNESEYGTGFARAYAEIVLTPDVEPRDYEALAAMLHFRRLWSSRDFPAAQIVKGAKRATIESWKVDLNANKSLPRPAPKIQDVYSQALDVRDADALLRLAELNYRAACARLRNAIRS